ncbi:hypothetical protein P175DRAFT_0535848 [Aspergillus ochraceoroseus IBT 24754]|uniref:LysM domain-containing protein n=1 Tax=Aspergillus ochraceoroseus IBT 24754 TaxID=1392256 RepID=A0A2T5LML5_9EURO|nr:uncharacterized protein P175DRAFT_0535848 [Aspergillus ochraceoroseus IBT 24754]PTU17516.1 hypothetical protein P175DRAFT_0535848 [Aspergillus ochraceoroseus IBT 24754]
MAVAQGQNHWDDPARSVIARLRVDTPTSSPRESLSSSAGEPGSSLIAPAGPTDVQDPQCIPIEQEPIPCFTDVTYASQVGDTCDSVALTYSVASAAPYSAPTPAIKPTALRWLPATSSASRSSATSCT